MKKNKVLGWEIIFWGKPYLDASLKSLYDQCDKILIFYTDRPSQGYDTDQTCPDSEEDLLKIAEPYMDKIQWITGRYPNEGVHTNIFWQFSKGYDYAFRLDTDEVLPDGFVNDMISQAETRPENIFRVPFVHFWRSFDKVCRDAQFPVRLYKLDGKELSEAILDNPDKKTNIFHFGYAIPDKYMQFKWECSGHKSELKPGWLDNTWANNIQTDCHPVSRDMWDTESFDKNTLPDILKQHPNFNKEII